ncbi:MAG: flagellar motor switch protein [Alphaproteobacteria bacterium]|nr:MAG: flagellar motor switch protein [Alphaproteobacteria bacterium]
MIELATNVAIIVLLIAAILYGVAVSRRIRRLSAMLAELEPLVLAYSEAVEKSEASVRALKEGLEAESAQADVGQETAGPTGRVPGSVGKAAQRAPAGVRVVHDKSALVRRFFETPHAGAGARV